ncbi:hypothetical protein [Pseudoalteromonas sp. MTN2-4]|uniref:hypothetical protein n=1 Tax=Pseudoalteromonas sp. MTN2-4 TaxID=3056555 RepID=UPI0036F22539
MSKYLGFMIILLSGCSSVVSNEYIATNLTDKCFSIEKPVNIYVIRQFPNDSYEAFTEKSNSRLPSFESKFEFVRTLTKGELIKITSVVEHSYGSAGHCWKINAKSEQLPGVEFELPSCWMDNMSPWFSPDSPSQLKGGQKIEVATDFIKASEKCI